MQTQELVTKQATKTLKMNRKRTHTRKIWKYMLNAIRKNFSLYTFLFTMRIYHSIRKIVRMKCPRKFIEQNVH
jgi:hypothetical protein